MARIVTHICEDCHTTFEAGPDARFCPACRKKRMQANAKAVRRCVVCGREFVGNARALYCPECRVLKHRENYHRHIQRKKEGQTIVRGETLGTCVVCGKPFVVMAGGQKYCPDCAAEAYKEADRQQSRAWAAREKERKKNSGAKDGKEPDCG